MIEFSKRILESLKISRLSAWLLDKQEISIESIGEYELDNGHFNKGSKILKNEAPEYFDAILDNQLLIFDDVYSDPKTKGLIGYCKHHNIVSMMDIPMRIEGEFIGVICFEIKDKEKTITENDKIFALSTAQVLASTLESRFRRSLQYHIQIQTFTAISHR
jgi:two-component system, sensor histidine kinase and response regulator